VKEQVVSHLSDGDRAALQGLIPLAGALGAGTIFALFFGGRRRGSGIAVFELFAIVAGLGSVGTTAYLAIALLHSNEAIGDKVLTQTATPLIFAVFLLVLVSVLGRLPGSAMRSSASCR
jgi:nitrate reductase gamma subunit